MSLGRIKKLFSRDHDNRQLKQQLAVLSYRITNLEKALMQLVDDVNAATKDLKAKVDTLQANQARVEQMLADLIASGGFDPADIAKLEEARDILTAEAADVDTDNADSPANPAPEPAP